ncbi:MAG: cupin domain-containing protein [Geminicoccaceae bacterium]
MGNAASDRVRVVKPGQTYEGKQGFVYGSGASAETVGSERICMNVLPMPSGARAKVHYHDKIETIAYLLEGRCAVYYGDQMEHRTVLDRGDQIFIPADVPHAPSNESGAPCTWIVVHSVGQRSGWHRAAAGTRHNPGGEIVDSVIC